MKVGAISGSHINDEHVRKHKLDYRERMKECAEWLVEHLYPGSHIEWRDDDD